jgi:hypothetical protein
VSAAAGDARGFENRLGAAILADAPGPWARSEERRHMPSPSRLSVRALVGPCLWLLALGGSATAQPSPQPAAGPAQERFGQRGKLVITNDFALYHSRDQGFNITIIHPSFDYFVVDAFSVGMSGGFGLAWSSSSDSNAAILLSLGLRLAVNLPLGDKLSVWPLLENSATFVDGAGGSVLTTTLVAPLLIHPATHFFIGAGPYVRSVRGIGGGSNGSGGVATVIGGWW